MEAKKSGEPNRVIHIHFTRYPTLETQAETAETDENRFAEGKTHERQN
jgi:hypothetical protein